MNQGRDNNIDLQTVDDTQLWIFAYGSLIWKPEFETNEAILATLQGFKRSFCMWSVHYRGSKTKPGLVLALEKNPKFSCRGVALKPRVDHAKEVLQKVRKRELISSAYIETRAPIILDNGNTVPAIFYVVNTNHSQYCGKLSTNEKATIIHSAKGNSGWNRDYLFETVKAMEKCGIQDPYLTNLANKVGAITPH